MFRTPLCPSSGASQLHMQSLVPCGAWFVVLCPPVLLCCNCCFFVCLWVGIDFLFKYSWIFPWALHCRHSCMWIQILFLFQCVLWHVHPLTSRIVRVDPIAILSYPIRWRCDLLSRYEMLQGTHVITHTETETVFEFTCKSAYNWMLTEIFKSTWIKNQYRHTDTRRSSSYNIAGLEDTTQRTKHHTGPETAGAAEKLLMMDTMVSETCRAE